MNTAILVAVVSVLSAAISVVLTHFLAEWRARADGHRSTRKLAIEIALTDWRAYQQGAAERTRDEVLAWNVERDDRTLSAFLAETFEILDVAADTGKSLKEIAAVLRKRE